MRTLVIDLDHTLLNTTDFKIALGQALGLTLPQFETVFAQYIKDYSSFTPADFLRGMSKQEQDNFYSVLKKLPTWLYPDSRRFLQQAVAAGWRVVILTFGDPAWQQLKLDYLQFPQEIEQRVTNGQKLDILKQYLPGDIRLIEDNATELDALKQAYPTIQAYWLRRPNGKYREHQPTLADATIEALTINVL